ncbi:MAG TPA: TRAM domain-containing protein [Thermoanaerobaculia bacterium]|nr:TRAM domain-containing protein [Thermoanaerobaculia bacterium]
MPLRTGERLEVRPMALVAGGESISRTDGLPIFVRGLYPGDVALIEIVESKKGWARGRVVELRLASPERRAAPCPVAEECGGCDWTALRLDAQLRAKHQILIESLRRIGRLDPASLPPIRIHVSPLNYRLRSRLHHDPATGAVGFFAAGSHRVIPLPVECEVVGPLLIKNIERVRTVARERNSSIRTFEQGSRLIVEAIGDEPSDILIHTSRFRFHLFSSSFFQVNRHLLDTLLELVSDLASRVSRTAAACDLYAGAGFFTLPLSEKFEQVTAVEEDRDSAALAGTNSGPAGNVEIIAMPVEEYLRTRSEPTDLALVDPPRAGLGRGVIADLDRLTREKIGYLSCDPVTFSRDASRLAACGWRIDSLHLVDLFPNTHHIETFSSWSRAG